MKEVFSTELTVLQKIRQHARGQMLSRETLETVIVALLTVYMVYLYTLKGYPVRIYSIILLTFFVGILAFGMYETIPAIIMYYRPFSSGAFRMKASEDEKQKICEEIDEAVRKKNCCQLTDILFTDKYALLEGERNIEVIRLGDMVRLEKKEYPFRQKYKGRFFLTFVDGNGGRHELDIRNGKNYNPVRQTSRILEYVRAHHPGISMELTPMDLERISAMLEEDKKIKG